MRVRAIINQKSGGLIDASASELADTLVGVFAETGQKVDVINIGPDGLGDAIDNAAASEADAVVVAGGDGTVRAAAEALLGSSKSLGVIPLGTFNRLAREIGMPLDPEGAARTLVHAKPTKIDVARVNGTLFLCNSLIGLPPRFSVQRAELRNRPFGDRVTGYWDALSTILRSRRRLELTIDEEGDERKLRVLSLAVSNNPYSEDLGFGLVRPRLDTGQLGLYISKHRSGLEMLWVLLRALVGVWGGDPALETSTARTIVVGSGRSKLLVSNDGEVDRLTPPLHYEIVPKALSLLMPSEGKNPPGH